MRLIPGRVRSEKVKYFAGVGRGAIKNDFKIGLSWSVLDQMSQPRWIIKQGKRTRVGM